MTVKQINSELKTNRRELADATKYKDELIKECAPDHIIAYQDKWIDYYKKKIEKYEAMLPEAERIEEEKMLKKIAKQQLKDKASTIGYIKKGNNLYGVTPEGKNWFADHNWFGYTDRTLHCYSLSISGIGLIFTSGTLEKVLETVAQH